MTWNYRIISHPFPGTWAEKPTREYKIHEVYMDGDRLLGYTEQGCAPFGETEEEIKQDFANMQAAFSKPILKVEDLDSRISKFGASRGMIQLWGS